MSYTVNITETAKCDLRDIAVNIAQAACDINTGIEFADRIERHFETLKDFPYSGSFPQDDEIRARGYRFLIYEDYLVFYTVNEQSKSVYIVAAFNAKKDYIRVMRNFMKSNPIS